MTAPSGWPDATNTGYRNAPGYPGSLTTYSSGAIQSNTTYQYQVFPGGMSIGDSGTHPVNVTFVGCRFISNNLEDANVAVYGDNITFSYCSFEPSAVAAPPTTYNQGYQYGIDHRYDGKLTVSHCDFWGFGNGIQIGFSSQAEPLTVSDSWFHDARDDGGVDHTDGILENYGGPNYSYMTIHHNTIISFGNTNGIALQNGNGQGYDHLTVTNNYVSGFGYTLNVGGDGSGNTNVICTDNVLSDQLQPQIGFLYGWNDGSGNLWRRNTLDLPNPPGWPNNGAWGPAITQADQGRYYYPDGTAHATDYPG